MSIKVANFASCLGKYDATIVGQATFDSSSAAVGNLDLSMNAGALINTNIFTMPPAILNNGISFMGWFNPSGTGNSTPILDIVTNTANPITLILTGGYTPILVGSYNGVSLSTSYVLTPIYLNQWNFFCYTIECSGNGVAVQNIYLNNSTAAATSSLGIYAQMQFMTSYLGGGTGVYAKNFNGKIDDFRYYGRVITPMEYNVLYGYNYGNNRNISVLVPSVNVAATTSTGYAYYCNAMLSFASSGVFSYLSVNRFPGYKTGSTVTVSASQLFLYNNLWTWLDTSLNASTTYTYQITPCILGNTGGIGTMVSLTTTVLAAGVVSIASIAPYNQVTVTVTGVNLSYFGWKNNVTGTVVANNGAGVLTFTDTVGIQANTLYTYSITPYNSLGTVGTVYQTTGILTAGGPAAVVSIIDPTITTNSITVLVSGAYISYFSWRNNVTGTFVANNGVGTMTFVDTVGITGNKTYTYTVVPYNANGYAGPPVTSAGFTTPSGAATITSVTVTSISSNSISLAVAGIYLGYFSWQNNVTGTVVTNNGAGMLTFTDASNLVQLTNYTYTLVPYNALGAGPSYTTTAFQTTAAPAVVTSVTATSLLYNSITLTVSGSYLDHFTWRNSVTGYMATSYVGTIVDSSNIVGNTAYTYTIVPYNVANVMGQQVNSATLTTPTGPSAITGATSTQTYNSLTVTVLGNAYLSYIQWKNNQTGTTATTTAGILVFTDTTNLTPLTTYTYTITPYNSLGAGGSPYTTTGFATTSATPSVSGATATVTPYSVTVTVSGVNLSSVRWTNTTTGSTGSTVAGTVSFTDTTNILSNTAYSYTIVPVNASGSTGASYTTPSPFTTAIGNTVNTFSNALTISPAPPIAPDRISVTPGGRMLVVGYATLMYWTQYNASNNTWGSWTATGEPNVRGYLGLDTTADGNRGVAAVQNVGCFFFTWTGSNYSALTQTLDGTVRNYQGIAVSANGSTLVASAFNDYIYFASWNGANYGSFTRTLEPYSRPYIGIGISADGSRLAYGGDPAAPYANTSDPGVVYISVWNGTNYSAGVQTLNTTARSARNFYFSPNKNILWYATNSGASVAQTTGPAIFYAYTNNMTSSYYGTFNAVPAAAIPNNITAWGFCLSRSGNTLFAAPYANATIYQSTVTFSN